jgi:mannose-1-phosphate guanylyltransferase
MYYALIMAGGSGTRLWPLSRELRPKQALTLTGEQTMFQQAVARLAPMFPPERILCVTRRAHVSILQSQAPDLPAFNFIVEPEGRGTAPAIGLAALHIQQRDPQAVMAVLTADHFIADQVAFRAALQAANQAAQDGLLLTLGIRPESPSTGFGYIHQGQLLTQIDGQSIFQVLRFVEKPDPQTAEMMMADGQHSWNSGMFVWRVDRILAEFKRQMPGFHAQLAEIRPTLDTPEYEAALARIWPQVAKQTIDYGVMEGATNVAVIPVSIGWTDVGSWTSVSDLLSADPNGNTAAGPHLAIESSNTLMFGRDRLIAVLGVNDLIVVDAGDAILVCPRSREQDVRKIVDALKARGDAAWL